MNPLWPEDYICEGLGRDHCIDVLAGCYDVVYNPATPPTILDIGANIGAFARWAAGRWPGATIHCYEPHPANFILLCRTVHEITGTTFHVHPCAVLDSNQPSKLVQGGINCGEYTLANEGDERPGIIVDVISTLDLPKADILKVDAEGAENVIIATLALAQRLRDFSAVMVEFHYDKLGEAIAETMRAQGFTEVGRKITSPHRGVLKYLRTDLVSL